MVALFVSTSMMSWSRFDVRRRPRREADDGRLGDGLAELRHDDGDAGHSEKR